MGKKEKSVIDKVMDKLDKDDSAMIPRPATAEDIAGCNNDLLELELEPLPQGYIDFLMKFNGLAWNGIEFYSTYRVSEEGDPDGYFLMDLVSMNDEFSDMYEYDERVLLGRDDEWYFTYNIETQKYEVLERECSDALEEFDTFADLFWDEVGGRLGLIED